MKREVDLTPQLKVTKLGVVLPVADELLADSNINVRRLLFPTRLERLVDRVRAHIGLVFQPSAFWIGASFDPYARWLYIRPVPMLAIRLGRFGRTRCANGVLGHDPYYDECDRDDEDEDLD